MVQVNSKKDINKIAKEIQAKNPITNDMPQVKTSRSVRDDDRIINGINFGNEKPVYDYSEVVALDIPEEVRHNELSHYWVNDTDDNIQRYQAMGYCIQPGANGKEYKQRVGVNSNGHPMYAHLMVVPKNVVTERLRVQESKAEGNLSLGSTLGGGSSDISSFGGAGLKVSDTYEQG